MTLGAGVVVGVILAGGRSRRMGGGDKCLLPLAGKTLLERVRDRLAPQCARLVLNANGDPERFRSSGLEVVADSIAEWPGPLAGVLAGCDWARANAPSATHVATAAADTPFFPVDLVERLQDSARAAGRSLALAATRSDGDPHLHPVFGLWPVVRADALRRAVAEDGVRKILDWTKREGYATAVFDALDPDPFLNVNEPADLARCERAIAGVRA